MMIKLYNRLRRDPTSSGISWLCIESAKSDDAPVFLYHYKDAGTPCLYDDFFLTIDEAFEHAENLYGVDRDSWRTEDFFKEQAINLP